MSKPRTIYASLAELKHIAEIAEAAGWSYIKIEYTSTAIWHELQISNPHLRHGKGIKIPLLGADAYNL